MKSRNVLIAITLLNGAFALVSLSQLHSASAASDVAPVLRGRHLEIVDDRGRVRASITVHRPDPGAAMVDGKPATDSVVLRLINPDGGPGVKLASSENAVGLAMIAKQGDYIQVFPSGVKVTKDSRQLAAWP
jgi:hypothetical protein